MTVLARIAAGGGTDALTTRVVLEGLQAHNVQHVGPMPHVDLVLSVYREGGAEPVGGLIGGFGFGWLFVRLFYLPEDLRGQGVGRDLLGRAEAEAAARGCLGVRLDTFDFQAPGFYARQGYTEFGTLADCPPGHTRHFFFKRLAPAPDGGTTCST